MTTHDVIILVIIWTVGNVIQGIWPWRSVSGDEAHLGRLERKVNQILDKLGITHDTNLDRVRELILEGKKIHAIKLYREQTGSHLGEAKSAVDQIGAQLKAIGSRPSP